MTEAEIVELALRRIASRADEGVIRYWFAQLADEIAKVDRDYAAGRIPDAETNP